MLLQHKQKLLYIILAIYFICTVGGLAKVAIFTTNFDAENQTSINHKCVCGELNCHYCKTAVSCCSYPKGGTFTTKLDLKN